MKALTDRAILLTEYLNLPNATGVEDAKWERFQVAHLNCDSLFRIEDKSRQIAWSWLIAAEAVADALLDNRSSIFVSINKEEAKEKIRYAKSVFENLEGVQLPKLKADNQFDLEFDNGARLISHSSRPPRGKPRMNIYLDEFAHVQHDRAIYRGAVPVITKGGRVRIGSSPMGASGVFWEIFTESIQKYPDYVRRKTPWWEIEAFCRNVTEARKLAPTMLTAERVEMFGKARIQAIYANVLLEDFQQEYEAEFVDETTAWITWEEIQANTSGELLCAIGQGRGGKDGSNDLSHINAAIDQLKQWVTEKEVEIVFSGGMDIGRTRNTSELYLVGESTTKTYPLRLALTMDNTEFDDQFTVLSNVMANLPVKKLLIDQTGIGRNLAEKATKSYPTKIEGVDFTNATKALWAGNGKMVMQQRKAPIPVDRDLAYQIHSIKKLITPSKNVVFDTERNEKHHADKFWAWVLAVSAALEALPTAGFARLRLR
jgi:phage FluMu gp28-like protein